MRSIRTVAAALAVALCAPIGAVMVGAGAGVSIATLTLPTEAYAAERYIGTITATAGTSKTNASTATPFHNAHPNQLGGKPLAIQCDAAAYVRALITSSETITSTNGVKIGADVLFDMDMAENEKWIGIECVSGTCNCDVFLRSRG